MIEDLGLLATGGGGALTLGAGFWYLLREIRVVRDELSAHKLHVAEDYATKEHLQQYVVKPLSERLRTIEALVREQAGRGR